MTIVETAPLAIHRTIRTPSPDTVLRGQDESPLELLAFNAGVARTLDPLPLTLGRPRPLPLGKGPCLAGNRHIWFIEGRRRVEPLAPKTRLIDGERVALLNLDSREVVRRGPLLDDPQAVIGIDADGRPLVLLRTALVLLDPTTLKPAVRLDYGHAAQLGGLRGAVAMLGDRRSAAILPHRTPPERLWVLRW